MFWASPSWLGLALGPWGSSLSLETLCWFGPPPGLRPLLRFLARPLRNLCLLRALGRTCMSEGDLDLEALAEAFQQLHLATYSLISALRPPSSSSQNDDWEVVQAEPREPADIASPGFPNPPSGSSSSPRPFRFRSSPIGPPHLPESLPSASNCVLPWRPRSVWPVLQEPGRQVFRQVKCSGRSRTWFSPLLRSLSRTAATLCSGTPLVPAPASTGLLVISRPSQAPSGRAPFCHGWPTEGEARVYAWAAGRAFPED